MDREFIMTSSHSSRRNSHREQNNLQEIQNLPSNTQQAQTRSRATLLEQVKLLNQNLRYFGFQSFQFIDNCPVEHLDELCTIVNELINARQNQIIRLKEQQRKISKLNFDKNKLMNENDRLLDKGMILQKQKEELQATINRIKSQQKLREEKALKEKDIVLKEKKAIQSRETAYKNQIKKKEDKIKDLQDKCRKLLDKNSKTQYKIGFQIFKNIETQCRSLPLAEEELRAIYENKRMRQIEERDRTIEKLKSYLISLFCKISNILSNDEQYQQAVTLDKFKAYLELPAQQSQTVLNTLSFMFSKIETYLFAQTAYIDEGLSTDTTGLINTIEQMKSFYTQVQELDQTRSSFTAELFNILNKKEKLNRNTLEKITNNFNQSQRHYLENIKEQENFLKAKRDRQKQAAQFLKKQIERMSIEASVMETVKKEMGDLFYLNNQNEQLL